MPIAPWRRNLYAVAGATFLGYSSFTMVMPFLPLYFQELGVHDVGEIAMWSGLSLGVTPAVTAALAPTWGRLADRFGQKIMILRSLVSFVLLMVALANVSAAWQVFALRAVQGLVAGYGGLALAMAAELAPVEQVAGAIGLVQTVQRLGPALGPALGGALAGLVGIRHSFYVASCAYALAALWLFFGYREQRARRTGAATNAQQAAALDLRGMARLENGVMILCGVFALQVAERGLGPALPLQVAASVGESRAAIVAGTLFSLIAGAGAVANLTVSWWLRQASARTMVTAASAVAALGVVPLAFATSWPVLVTAAVVFGAGMGLATTVLYAVAGRVIPATSRSKGFGYLTSASLAGVSISPVVAGFVGAASLRAVFLGSSVVLAGLAVASYARIRGAAAQRPGGD